MTRYGDSRNAVASSDETRSRGFDWGLPNIVDEYKCRFLAYYYNQAASDDREVVVTNKREALPADVSASDAGHQ